MPRKRMVRTTIPGEVGEMVSVTAKMDPRMAEALGKLADLKFMSLSGLMKAAAEEFLKAHGVDWRRAGGVGEKGR